MQQQVSSIAMTLLPLAKSKSSSLESLRIGPLDPIAEEAPLSRGAQTAPAANCKRNTLSVLSGRVSGPSRYRSRTMVVVSYDGEMQKSLELLVRAIGTGRNMLRKARMESKMNELAALAPSSDEDEDEDEDADRVEEPIVSRISYRPRMSSMRARAAARTSGRLGLRSTADTPVALFDATDKKLEQAQELCEKAAHLTLREGDCRKELVCIRTNFEHVLQTARTEVVKCTVRKAQEPPELQSHDTSDTSVSSVASSCKDHFPHASIPAPVSQPASKTVPHQEASPLAPKIVSMEVDDDEEDEDMNIVLPPVRLTSRLNGRAR